jgi:hypothetical protein
MNIIRSLAIFGCLSGSLMSLLAQPAAVQQLQNNQVSRELQGLPPGLAASTNVPDLYTGESTDVGPQRILRLAPRRTWFDVLLDSQCFYSDNANYAGSGNAIGSAVFVNTVQAAFAPPSIDIGRGRGLASIGVSSQWYNYANSRIQALDFDAQTIFANTRYLVDNWQFAAGVNLTRLVNQGDYDETYREALPTLGVQRVIPLNDRMFFSVADLVDYHFTQVPAVLDNRRDINDRLDNILSFTFTWQATRHLVFQPYYRFQYSYFQHNALATSDRNDWMQSAGILAAYYFNPNISLRAFYNYNNRQTDDHFTPDYSEMNGGLGATLDIKF